MARDRLLTPPSVSSVDFTSAYGEHARLGRWVLDHAPRDIARQLDGLIPARPERWSDRVRAPADEDVSYLAAQRRCDVWVYAHRTEIERWSQLEGILRRHEYRLGQLVAYNQPEHTAAILGPLPERIGGVQRWQSAAGAIEAYRSRWKITVDPLGPEPLDPEQHAHWTRAVDAIGLAVLSAPRARDDGPGAAWLSSLWDRVQALDNARLDPSFDVSSASEPTPFARNRELGSERDFGDDFGL